MDTFRIDTAILESSVPSDELDLAIDLTKILHILSHYPPALHKRAVDAIEAVGARVLSQVVYSALDFGLAGIEYKDDFEIRYIVSEGRFIVLDIETGFGPEAGRSRSGSFVWRSGGFLFFPHPEKGNGPTAWIEGNDAAGFWRLVFRLLRGHIITITAVLDGVSDPTRTDISADVTLLPGPVAWWKAQGCIIPTGSVGTPGMTLSFTRAGTPHGPGAWWEGRGYPDFDDGTRKPRLVNSSGDRDMRNLVFISFSGDRHLFADWLDDDQNRACSEIFVSRPVQTLSTGYTVHIEGNDGLTRDRYGSGAEVYERPVGGLPRDGLWCPTGEPATNIARPHADLFQTAPSTSLRSGIDSGLARLELRTDRPVPLQ